MYSWLAFRSRIRRYFLISLLVLTATLSAQPAEACGCGIYIPREGQASVNQEQVLIRWDGQTEDIIMTLGVLGSSKEAALIIPVPSQATVKLADGTLFQALQELTKPRIRYEFQPFPLGMGGSAPPGSVSLLERQTLGPFDVSTLAATNANALSDWLLHNGYNLPPETAQVLEPYVAQGWYYVAVRLSPSAGASELAGTLDPLWITFTHDEIVYPMRASALARDTLTVFLYVLAEHRVQHTQSFGPSVLQYADWIDPTTLATGSPLVPLVPKRLFLTKVVDVIYEPQRINSDYVFEFTATDEVYRESKVEYIHSVVGIPLCLFIPGILIVSIIGVRFIKRRVRALPKPVLR